MRITGGVLGGRRLATLSGRRTRPTSDRVRQALFNILGDRVVDAVVLDLFAGTGAFAFEAISRGAQRAVLVEKDRRAVAVIRDNAKQLDVEEHVVMKSFDLLQPGGRLAELDGPFDVIFIDPPYRLAGEVVAGSPMGELLEALFAGNVVGHPGGCVVLEHDRRATVAEDWTRFRLDDRRTYGDTDLSFLVRKEP